MGKTSSGFRPTNEEEGHTAADGGYVAGACNTMGEFVRSLEDGQFDADCYEAIKELSADMHEHSFNNGGLAKGKVTITLDFRQEGTITEIKSTFKVAGPAPKRPKSVMWHTSDHRLSPTNPQQQQLFGIRDVTGTSEIRDVQ